MPEPGEVVMHGDQPKTRVVPMPGEIWLRDYDETPVIITKLTHGRVSWVQPSPGGDDNTAAFRESYCGSDYFFAEDWTRLWPPITRRSPWRGTGTGTSPEDDR